MSILDDNNESEAHMQNALRDIMRDASTNGWDQLYLKPSEETKYINMYKDHFKYADRREKINAVRRNLNYYF